MKTRIFFEPIGIKTSANQGESILDTAIKIGLGLRSDCGGFQICGKCKVIINDQIGITKANKFELNVFSREELLEGYRLACAAKVLSDVDKINVIIPNESIHRKRKYEKKGIEKKVKLDPLIMSNASLDFGDGATEFDVVFSCTGLSL